MPQTLLCAAESPGWGRDREAVSGLHGGEVLPTKAAARLRPEERTRAYLATRGERLPALARMLSACIRLRGSLSLAVVLQVIGVVIGFLLVAFLTFYAGLPQLGALELMLYLAFWVLAALVVPSLRRP